MNKKLRHGTPAVASMTSMRITKMARMPSLFFMEGDEQNDLKFKQDITRIATRYRAGVGKTGGARHAAAATSARQANGASQNTSLTSAVLFMTRMPVQRKKARRSRQE